MQYFSHICKNDHWCKLASAITVSVDILDVDTVESNRVKKSYGVVSARNTARASDRMQLKIKAEKS